MSSESKKGQEKPKARLDVLKITCKNIIITTLGPVLDHGLYYYDIYTDAVLSNTLRRNCHDNYFLACVSIMVSSYILTAAYLKHHFNEPTKRAVFYPFYHGLTLFRHIKRNVQAIWQGCNLPEEPAEEKRHTHSVMFIEAISESLPQLSLSCLLIREFGLSSNSYEKFNQISGLISSLMSLILLFAKRRALIKDNMVPGLSSASMWKQIMIWCLPLVAFFLSYYALAFTPNSLCLTIFCTSVMLHPLVAIPISTSVNSVLAALQNLVRWTCKTKSPQRSFKMSMSFYLALICTGQAYLAYSWDNFRQSVIDGIGNDTELIVMNSFKNFLKFEQCNCTASDPCQLPVRSRPAENIEDFLKIEILKVHNISLPLVLIGLLIVLLTYFAIELCASGQTSVKLFMFGPKTDTDPPKNIGPSENMLEMADTTEKKPKKSKKSRKCIITVSFVVSILYVISFFMMPMLFNKAYVMDSLFCTDGYFDQDNSSQRIFDCKECNCSITGTLGNSNNCDKKTGECNIDPGCRRQFAGIFCHKCNDKDGYHGYYPNCVADCQWRQWGEWNECDVKQCTKSRSRTIRRKADGGKPCKEKDAVNSTTCTTPCEDGSKIKTQPNEPICPSDWHLLNKMCYYFDKENLDFVTASKRCKIKGAILYEPKDQISHDQVFKLSKSITTGYSDDWVYWWIGITDLINQDDYRFYSDNTKVKWFNWAKNEPGPSVEIEDCVQFITKSRYNIPIDGRWNDVPCDKTIPDPKRPRDAVTQRNKFICQKDPGSKI